MRNTVLRIAVAGALMAAGVAAHADVVLPSTGNGEVVLFVYDATAKTSYARGIQVNVQTVVPGTTLVPTASYTGPVQINYTLPTITADANLQAFLGGTHSGDTFTWGLEGGGTSTGTAPGADLYVTTSQTDLSMSVNAPPTTQQIQTGYASLQAMLQTLNGNIGSGVAGDGSSTAAGKDGIWGGGATNDPINWYGNGPNSSSSIGQAAGLFGLTTNTKKLNPAQVYFTAQQVVLLANGTLESVAGAPPVPLPAAAWLLGSGLLGLAGIGRRRRMNMSAG